MFIDTNIWLSFYHYSSDDLEELRKLVVLIERGQVVLHLPDQVNHEFRRNRESKVNEALKKFKDDNSIYQFPQLCKEYEQEYNHMRDALHQYKQAKSELMKKLYEDFNQEKLKADRTIRKLFARAKDIPCTDEIFTSAERRCLRGNPPGKAGSYGDAINWECLLVSVPDEEDLYLIADDIDYRASGSDEAFSPYLEHEWGMRKQSEVRYYRRLVTFFREKYPQIKLATELEKELLIAELVGSRTFRQTRRALRRLAEIEDLTTDQLNEVVSTAINNDQVYMISDDKDIEQFMWKLTGKREHEIIPDNFKHFRQLWKTNKWDQDREDSG